MIKSLFLPIQHPAFDRHCHLLCQFVVRLIQVAAFVLDSNDLIRRLVCGLIVVAIIDFCENFKNDENKFLIIGAVSNCNEMRE